MTAAISILMIYLNLKDFRQGHMFILSSGNPFVNAYLQSDWFGKGVFLGLFILSAISWSVLIHKGWILFQVRRLSNEFISLFSEKEPLSLQFNRPIKGHVLEAPHPFFEIYKAFKMKALAIINRNHFFLAGNVSFSRGDLDLLESEMYVAIGLQMKKLEKHLFILPTIATLGPFVGLLGTVWGILLSFSHMQGRSLAGGTEGMLGGLSLALATTVIGLLIAIPALVGNNYLKAALREQRREMEGFSHLLLSSIEIHYQLGEHATQSSSSN
jgi:biopolymer transport protein TolQ